MNTVFPSQSIDRYATLGIPKSDLAHVFVREFVMCITDTAHVVVMGLTMLVHHVVRIIFSGSKKQVIWTNTCSIVAMMQDPQTIRDWAEVKFPRKTMRRNCLSSNIVKSPITIWANITYPIPATICLRDMIPEVAFRMFRHFALQKGDPLSLADSCRGNQHFRLWGPCKKKPAHVIDSLDRTDYSTRAGKVQ